MINPPLELTTVPIDLNKSNPKVGISMCIFNNTGIYLLTKNGMCSDNLIINEFLKN